MNLRLDTLAQMVDGDSRVADIGTDHAYLPIKLVEQGKVKYAVASDIRQGPLDNARRDIERAGLDGQIKIRLGAGLSPLKKQDLINTVVIAGMGGKLICHILNDGWLKKQIFATLILEANIAEAEVRSWLMIHNYQIVQEKLIEDAGHIYELIKARLQDHVFPLSEKQIFFGPFILRKKGTIFIKKWSQQLAYKKKLLVDLNKAKKKDREKILRLQAEILMIEEELK